MDDTKKPKIENFQRFQNKEKSSLPTRLIPSTKLNVLSFIIYDMHKHKIPYNVISTLTAQFKQRHKMVAKVAIYKTLIVSKIKKKRKICTQAKFMLTSNRWMEANIRGQATKEPMAQMYGSALGVAQPAQHSLPDFQTY